LSVDVPRFFYSVQDTTIAEIFGDNGEFLVTYKSGNTNLIVDLSENNDFFGTTYTVPITVGRAIPFNEYRSVGRQFPSQIFTGISAEENGGNWRIRPGIPSDL
jgi:hypothetical protein